jgi:hypothetical protein
VLDLVTVVVLLALAEIARPERPAIDHKEADTSQPS